MRFLQLRGAGDAAEDIVQEIWLRVKRCPLAPVTNPRSYLFRMAHNLLIDQHRSDRQRRVREMDWVALSVDGQPLLPTQINQEGELMAQTELQMTLNQISMLGEPTASIFIKFRIEGVSQKQIARDMNYSLANIEKHLQKAYKAMTHWRKKLTHYGEGGSLPFEEL